MDTLDARNLDLQVQSTADGPICRIERSPAGNATAAFRAPFPERELRDFWQRLSEPHQGSAERMAEQNAVAQQVGDRLFRAAFPQELHRCLHRSLDLAYQQRAQLRIRLSLEQAPELLHLPWEYLYDFVTREFLAQSIHTPLVRYVERLHQIQPVEVERPMRVLVVIASPKNHPPLHVEREWLSLVDTLDHLAVDGQMVVERLREPTLFGLQRQLREKRYHVLHFVGYGGFDNVSAESLLLFENRMGRSHFVSAQHLGTFLDNYASLQLCVLSYRQRDAAELRSPFVGAARGLLQRGLPGAVAFSHEPSPMAGISFFNAFYTALSALQPLDAAVTQARQAMLTEERSAAWGAPVCFTRTQDARIFYDPAQGPPRSQKQQVETSDSLWLRYM